MCRRCRRNSGDRYANFSESPAKQEILALAISLEEEDARIYDDFADGLRSDYPATAETLKEMRAEEDGHRHRLLTLYRSKFGEHIPLIRRHDVKGFVNRKSIWLVRPLGLDAVRKNIEEMELETKRFYEKAAQQASDASIRQLLGDLAEEERKHQRMADELESAHRASGAYETEAATRKRLFVLQVIQPGLAGLMDGSVSTLAPLFAAAFATRHSDEGTELVNSRKAGDRFHEKLVLGYLGTVHATMRDFGKAVTAYENALALARDLGDRRHQADLLWRIAIQYDTRKRAGGRRLSQSRKLRSTLWPNWAIPSARST